MGAWIGAALTGLGALGGLFGQKQSSTSNVNNSTTNTPTYDPTAGSFRDYLINSFQKQIQSFQPGGEFDTAYRAGGSNNILGAGLKSSQSLDDLLASRGLARTTAGASSAFNNNYRTGQSLANFLNNVPVTEQQLTTAALQPASAFMASIPYATTQHQTGTVANTQTNGGGAGGAVQGGTSGLATYLGQLSAGNNLANILKNSGGWMPGGG